MRCIFCLEDRPGTKEHIFSRAIGGRLITDRECQPCNSTLGSRVDAALSDSFLVRNRRADLGLAGSGGTPPAIHEFLLGPATLAEDPDQKVCVKFNKTTGKLDIRAIPQIINVVMPDGTKGARIVVDERDADQIPKLIQRARRQAGFPPASAEQIAVDIEKMRKNVTAVENPKLLREKSYDFSYVLHAMIKIAYELAFLWLGEAYLDDPSAAELRTAICSPDPSSTDHLPVVAGDEAFDVFKLWPEHKSNHIAYALVNEGWIAIAVRIFDAHAAVVQVTIDTTRYLSGHDAQSKLRFLAIDPATGQMTNVPMAVEWSRIMAEIMAGKRELPRPSIRTTGPDIGADGGDNYT
jgi:hypothetical protein